MKKKAVQFAKTFTSPRFARGLAFLGLIAYFAHASYYALTQVSVLDEGAYLLKGLFFVEGKYIPFQDYGVLTNHMPLSFLSHGWIQSIFGPGLRQGRFFIVIVGLLMLVGLFLLVYRYRGIWLATIVVWLVAMNPATARFYSLATSQGLVAFLLVGALFFGLRKPGDKPNSRAAIMLSAALAAVLMLVRLNMVTVFIFLAGYFFWAYGRKEGGLAVLTGLLIILIGHLIFWPNILKLWAYWLPADISPFIDAFRQPEAVRFWNPTVGFEQRLFSLVKGFRLHFVSLMGLIFTALFWPIRTQLREKQEAGVIAFVFILYVVLILEHMAATLGLSYCISCYSVYLAFFSSLGLFLFALIFPYLAENISTRKNSTIVLLVILLAVIIGWGAYDDIGDTLTRIQVPRLRSWLKGEPSAPLQLWDVLNTRFNLSYNLSRKLIPAFAGLVTGMLIASAGFIAGKNKQKIGLVSISIFIVLGLVLVPTDILGNGYKTYDCGPNTLDGIEKLGDELRARISPGDYVYWRGGKSAVPLLYLAGINIYPPQINGDYTIYSYENSDELLKFSLWNEDLSDRWLQEADVVLVESIAYAGALKAAVESAGLVQTAQTSAPYTCQEGSEILVFEIPE